MALGPNWYITEADKLEKVVDFNIKTDSGTFSTAILEKGLPVAVTDELIRRYMAAGWSEVRYEENAFDGVLILVR